VKTFRKTLNTLSKTFLFLQVFQSLSLAYGAKEAERSWAVILLGGKSIAAMASPLFTIEQ
jgi:hypothetical protein